MAFKGAKNGAFNISDELARQWLKLPNLNGKPSSDVLRPWANEQGITGYSKKRTLTNLYNARPAWLDNAHKVLDAVVAKAYGWDDYTPGMPDEEISRRLLLLINLARA